MSLSGRGEQLSAATMAWLGLWKVADEILSRHHMSDPQALASGPTVSDPLPLDREAELRVDSRLYAKPVSNTVRLSR
jgi:hypothetical protein